MCPELKLSNLVSYLDRQPDVAAAYLFGSYACGRATSGSDVDLAVLFNLPERDGFARFERRLELEIALEEIARRPVQVIDLETAPLLLQRQVRKHGKLILEKDRRRRVNFEVCSRRAYFDLQRVYRLRNAAILKALGE
ncbi:MAG: nucleotidyltransferase domain-containing protein [Bacillota bacterium]